MSQKERDLFKKALLDTVLPNNTNATITDILDDAEGDESPNEASLLHIKQRSLLFFDEQLTVYAVLQLPSIPEDLLKSYLSRLDIKLDAWAFSSLEKSEQAAGVTNPASDLVYSTPVKKTDDPIILVKGDETSEDGGVSMLVLWEAELTLNRPRIRIQNPAISIVASATLKPEPAKEHDSTEEYLPSFEPAEYNVFEPMKFAKGREEKPPYLAVSRLERVLPQVSPETTTISIRSVPPRSTIIIPGVSARTRFTRMPGLPGSSETITSLDFEVTPFVKLEISLEQVDLSLINGRVEPLTQLELPAICKTKDCLTLMYKLLPYQQTSASGIASTVPSPTITNGTLNIAIGAKISLSPVCISNIRISWTTSIDFSQALNPSFGPPSQPIQRMKRPNSLPFNSTTTPAPSSAINPRLSTHSQHDGLRISFAAPRHPIHPNTPFTWTVHVHNQTTRPIKLALIPLPHISRTTAITSKRHHAPKSSTASFHVNERRHTRPGEEVDIAQAICDENIVYVLQHSGGASVSASDIDLLSLTAELRIGPLGPGTCHESEIRMLALRAGALRCDAIRLVDLTKEVGEEGGGNVTDIRELPDVIVVEREEGVDNATKE